MVFAFTMPRYQVRVYMTIGPLVSYFWSNKRFVGHGGSVIERQTSGREVQGSNPTITL